LNEDLKILVNRCLTGQQTALMDFVRRFQGQVYGFCYRMLGQREDAEDATQETFIRVLKNLHRWDQQRDVEPWLLTIAGNRCRTKLSKRMRAPKSHTLEIPISDSSQQELAGEQLAEEVDLALKSIRHEYSQAFFCFHHKEMSYEEIAQELDVPLGTVKTWVHRARRELIRRLSQREVVWEKERELPRLRKSDSAVVGSAG